MSGSQESRKSARVPKTPAKMCSPQKNDKRPRAGSSSENAKTRATKNRNDPFEYDILVLSVCRCELPNWAFCHFVGYKKSEDRWRPFQDLSVDAIVASKSTKSSCSPKCCKRLRNQGRLTVSASGKGRGERERKRTLERDRESVRESDGERERGTGGERKREEEEERQRTRTG